MEKLPYVLLASPPIGPIALEALTKAGYPPTHVITDPKLSTEELVLAIDEMAPTFLLVVGFGAILKRPVLDTVAGQVINIHPSFLPEYRGPAPVVQAILDGARETGVSFMEIDTRMDHGPILAQERYPLSGNETPDELYRALTWRGVELFLETIDDYLNERLDPIPQNDSEATVTHFVKKDDGLLDLSEPAELLERKVRAYQGWPRTWVIWKGKRLIVDKAHVEAGQLRFDRVQPEGGKPMAFADFLAGQRLKPDEFYGQLSSAAKE